MDAVRSDGAAGAEAPVEDQRFGTFTGVFRPVFLTILGALLYLREGWLVGNAGLGGALLVIVAAYVITGTTALSLSSIATNLRVRAGGAFAIISAALGLEAGGSIGVPLYIAQTISSVMYLYAFTEGFGYLYPTAPPGFVVVGAFLFVGALVLASAKLAFRAQAAMLVVVAVAITSAFAGWSDGAPHRPALIGRFPEASLLECFALFFPAATGIMVGAGMSANLKSPRRSIPLGTMSAWALTFVIYVVAAFWYGTVASREELLTNKLVMIDHAAIGQLVLFGLLSSTLMAALSSLVAAPRLLQAMADHDLMPGSRWLRQLAPDGEPRNAVLVTLGVASIGLTAGSLDAIAPIITSFFVMTYLAVNLVVFLEQSLGLLSWRPTFRVPNWVPALGATACVLGLVLSSPFGGLPEVLFVGGIYLWLSRMRRPDTPWETVQSGIVQSVAAWAALRASGMRRSERSWKPDLLVPVSTPEEVAELAPLAVALVEVRGSVKWVCLHEDPDLVAALDDTVDRMRARGLFASWHLMPEESPGQGVRLSINAMQGTFFASNLLLLSGRRVPPDVLQGVVDHARRHKVGVVLAFTDPDRPAGASGTANVWLSDRSPEWHLELHLANLDLPVLAGWLLTQRKEGELRLMTVLRPGSEHPPADRFLRDLVELGRLRRATTHVLDGPFLDRLRDAPPADVHLFGLPHEVDVERLAALQAAVGAPCLFVQDSGQESALA